MNKDDIKTYLELKERLNSKAIYVCEKLGAIYPNYKQTAAFEVESIDLTDDGEEVEITSVEYFHGESDYWFASFPSYLLSYTDEELEDYINQELEKQRQEEEQKKKKLEKQLEEQAKALEEKERKEYERLKEKFENTNTNRTISRTEFFMKFCRTCGSQRCEGIDSAWGPGCKFYREFNIIKD